MIFTELRFLGFFLLVFALHWTLPTRRARQLLLLAASYTFYGAWDVRFLSLIILSTCADFAAARLIARSDDDRRRTAILSVTVVLNLGILGVFKYFNFFASSFAALLESLGFHASLPTLHIILPVGISFYTFQSLSYTIDVYRRRLEPETDLPTYALFVAFFPQLVAGPIVRAVDFLPQLRTTPALAAVAWRPLLLLFLWGYAKKAVLSDNFAPAVDAFFAAPGSYDTASAWLGVLLYSAQIYCDFSGYSDMAIATAGMLGYRLCRNFDHPYVAASPREFWRRWHISLSTWLRDYVYIPLGGNRGTATRVSINLLLTMLLGGLWHGAAWTFVAWGALHGLALVADHRWGPPEADLRTASRARRFAGWIATMLLVLVGWVFFRATDFGSAATVLRGLAGANGGALALPALLWFHLGAALLIHVVSARGREITAPLLRLRWTAFAFCYGALVAVVLSFVNTAYRPFIYFQF